MARVCSVPGCPTIHDGTTSRCDTHAAQHERARGTRQQRGYGSAHDKLRAEWAPKVATGTVPCWRCGQLISSHTPWDLGHDDKDRTRYRGPEHPRCNRTH